MFSNERVKSHQPFFIYFCQKVAPLVTQVMLVFSPSVGRWGKNVSIDARNNIIGSSLLMCEGKICSSDVILLLYPKIISIFVFEYEVDSCIVWITQVSFT